MTEKEMFYAKDPQEWRQWLQENHNTKQSIWLVHYKKKTNTSTVNWSDAVDEALCFGWIDGKRQSIDDEKYMQFFCRRKPNSTWSKINKTKIDRLIEARLMSQAGFNCIETAKKNGSWKILDEVEERIIPEDLEAEFQKLSESKDYFLSLSSSDKRNILQWLVLAKRQETRQKRITEIAELAAQKLKPKQFR
jgi:uncharacterized protein YdeI (YjbR/CyaY-like superfamily)